jgi:Transmembrane family 220, helix
VNPYSRGWRAADAVMSLLFTFGAVVQVNDPDPARWIAVYALAAAACLLSLLRRTRWSFPAILGAVALGWAATLAPRVVGRVPFGEMFGAFEMQSVGIEESREMYGLLIIAVWMAVLAWRAWRDPARMRSAGSHPEQLL